MNLFTQLRDKDTSKYPANMGKPWKDDEVLKLLKFIQKKKSILEIAQEHERTEGGIRSQLRGLAADYHFNENRSIEEIQKYTGLSKEEIEDTINRRKNKRNIQESPVSKAEQAPANNITEMMIILKDIQAKLAYLIENK